MPVATTTIGAYPKPDFLAVGDWFDAAADGTLIAELTPQEGGFVSGVYRVILRERTKHGVAPDAPLALRRRDTGRLEIHDPTTGWSADLMGFGADNAKAFARLLAH